MFYASHRGWFRFNLRMLFVLLTVVCIGLGWFSRQLWIVRHRRAMLTQLEMNYWASAAFDDRKWHENEGK